MSKGITGAPPYTNELTHSAGDGTGEKVLSGSETQTFNDGAGAGVAVSFVKIGYASKACYIARTKALVEATPDGEQQGRIYVPEGASGQTYSWGHEDVFFMPYTNGETPFLAVEGYV